MKRSYAFCPTLKEVPKEAALPSHRLMLRTGMIYQTVSGIYSWLPLGQKVLKNIEAIIDKEMSKIHFQRIIMPTIQPASLWKESGRYDAYGKEMLRIQDRHDREMLYAPTSEEVVTDIMRHFTHSYKSLPQHLYQIHWKFRDEIRPRFGVMRGREFLMKDGYSFDLTEEAARKTYENVFNAYIRIFDEIFVDVPDLKAVPVKADTGPIGGDLSHEFQILAPHGESDLFFDKKHYEVKDRSYETLKDLYAATDETHDPNAVDATQLATAKGIELGHIFYYGDKYSKALDFKVTGEDGKPVYPLGGCYGIGVSRLVASIIEASHDDRGIIWPVSVAPYKVGIVDLLKGEAIAQEIYEMLGDEIALWDDRLDVSPGIKFSEMDLLGMPYQIILGKKWKESEMVEIKNRRTGEVFAVKKNEILAKLPV
ncbi:MAG: proline--tRNA ligase [Alphaproteobacteria bacterium]|nr:MAG: proline--tRNA ligase [Alphaproteobacteria bacterium]